ncbi:MAG: hypothetical protein K6V73_02050 [Firmicutes bacterium]|nr:hypothetical protein [Bacillota bacterium]
MGARRKPAPGGRSRAGLRAAGDGGRGRRPGGRPRMVEADLVKELAYAVAFMTALLIVLAALFSSPDEPTLTAQQVAARQPAAIAQVALDALDGQGTIASYGPPYNHGTGSLQSLGPFSPQAWAGVTIPVDAARAFVLTPLERMLPLDPALAAPLRRFESASAARRAAWEAAYARALARAGQGARFPIPAPGAGPLAPMLAAYVDLARTGALEAVINLSGRVYQTDFTRALLLLQDQPLQSVAQRQHLLGSEWGMMKEPGNYPGAVWLWFYTLLYQIPPYNASSSGDLMVGLTVGVVSLLLLLVPWIPGLRDIPYWVPLYRAIWRRHYAETEER